jgi:release factor glutamine methyltransferase
LPELDSRHEAELDRLIDRRLAGEPLGHLTGRQSFMGLDLVVGKDALLPRRETEILARAARGVVDDLLRDREEILVVDTCCGCGNVVFAMTDGRPGVSVVGVDLSPQAVEIATTNARRLGVHDRTEFRVGDLLHPVENLAGTVDLVTCNPPYIASANVAEMAPEISLHEPAMAFDGGPFGVKIIRRLVKEARPILRPSGVLAFEVGSGQGEPMSGRMKRQDIYRTVEDHRDADGTVRAIVARYAAMAHIET